MRPGSRDYWISGRRSTVCMSSFAPKNWLRVAVNWKSLVVWANRLPKKKCSYAFSFRAATKIMMGLRKTIPLGQPFALMIMVTQGWPYTIVLTCTLSKSVWIWWDILLVFAGMMIRLTGIMTATMILIMTQKANSGDKHARETMRLLLISVNAVLVLVLGRLRWLKKKSVEDDD